MCRAWRPSRTTSGSPMNRTRRIASPALRRRRAGLRGARRAVSEAAPGLRRRLRVPDADAPRAARLVGPRPRRRHAGRRSGPCGVADPEAPDPQRRDAAQRRDHRLLRLLSEGLHLPDRRDPERDSVAGRSHLHDLVRSDCLLLPAARRDAALRADLLRRALPARRSPGPGPRQAGEGAREARPLSCAGCRTSTSGWRSCSPAGDCTSRSAAGR